jgi:hypothetical protein
MRRKRNSETPTKVQDASQTVSQLQSHLIRLREYAVQAINRRNSYISYVSALDPVTKTQAEFQEVHALADSLERSVAELKEEIKSVESSVRVQKQLAQAAKFPAGVRAQALALLEERDSAIQEATLRYKATGIDFGLVHQRVVGAVKLINESSRKGELVPIEAIAGLDQALAEAEKESRAAATRLSSEVTRISKEFEARLSSLKMKED